MKPPTTTHVYNTRSCKYSLNALDDERKYRSKHVEQPKKIIYPTLLHLVGHFRIVFLDTRNHEYQEYQI